jgi:hypothetical protein
VLLETTLVVRRSCGAEIDEADDEPTAGRA